MGIRSLNTRPGVPLSSTASSLGPLADLAGTWIGKGFNTIMLPDFSSVPPSTGPKDFRLKLNSTTEILEFTPIGGAVANRGVISATDPTVGQPDISIFGLTYLQRVSDGVTSEALHIEPGMWIYVPATTVFPVNDKDTVVRMGTIPHGDSILAQSTVLLPNLLPEPGKPFEPNLTPDFAGRPTTRPFGGGGENFGYLENSNFFTVPMPPGINPPGTPVGDRSRVDNPNLVLADAIVGQTFSEMTVIQISTKAQEGSIPAGGILNIPFVTLNANAVELDAIFWIETVQQEDGTTFKQLQYTQTVILEFLGIKWPHVSVATLVKQ